MVYPALSTNRLVVKNNEIRKGISAADLSAGNTPGLGNGLQTIGEILMNPEYCSVWNSGEYSANWNFGNGEFRERVRLKFPSCKTVESFSCCSEWDLALVLPKLQKLNLVPPDVNFSDLTVSIPDRNVEMVTGVKTATCSRAVKVCTRSSETRGLNVSSDPLRASPGSCQEWVEVGCAAPAYGLEAVGSTVSVPDITKVKIAWKGMRIKSSSIEVDMTKPEFKGTCKKGCPTSLKVPVVNFGKATLDLAWACLEHRLSALLAIPDD